MTMSEKVEHTRLECFEHTQTRSSERPQYLDAHMKAQSEAGWKLVSTASNGDKRNTWVSLYWQRPVDLSRLKRVRP